MGDQREYICQLTSCTKFTTGLCIICHGHRKRQFF